MARVADGEIGIKALVTPRRRLAIVIAWRENVSTAYCLLEYEGHLCA